MAQKSNSNTKRRIVVAAVAVAAALVLVLVLWPSGDKQKIGPTYTVRRQDLVISVREGGSLIPHGAAPIKCEVEGQTRIIRLVPDGTIITEQDVQEGRVLVELDSSGLTDKFAQQEITVQSAEAGYTQARESLDIRIKQNESDINAGNLRVKFAFMDLQKSLGEALATRVLAAEIDLLAIAEKSTDWPELAAQLEEIGLGGASLQKLRELQADIGFAQEEVSRAEDKFKWSTDLGPTEVGGSGYITRSEWEADRLALRRREVDLEQARLALQIYLKYELPKEAEKLSSDYREAQANLERIEAKARAEHAKAQAELVSRKSTYERQNSRLEKLATQIEHCTIRAPGSGMVVYASTGRRWNRAVIEEGATVRERQELMSIPGPNDMAVEVKVHESAVRKVAPGLRVRITPDAFKDRILWGTVKSVATTPDSQNWINPDLKVYVTLITVDEVPRDLKPGMSAQIEIMVNTLPNVVVVPVQAVTTLRGKTVCYVVMGTEPLERAVEVGETNDRFVEIKSGLSEGDQVLLHPPVAYAEAESATQDEEAGNSAEGDDQAPAREEGNGSNAPDESPKSDDGETGLPAEVSAALQRLPEEARGRALERWNNASPEEQQKMLEQFKAPHDQGESGRRRPPGEDRAR